MISTKTKLSISNKEIWSIAVPIMLGNLAQTIITFTDTAFLGHVGMIELSASMMAGLYYFVFTTLAMGFARGVQIFVARRYGEHRVEQTGVVFFHGIVFVLGLGFLLLGLLYFCSGWILPRIIASADICASAFEYVKYRQFGILFVVFNFLFRSFYVGISRARAITYSTIIMAIVNIFMDYCLIFGNLGFPRMGVGGAAIASLSAEVCAFCFFWIYTYIHIPKSYTLFRRHSLQPSLLKNMLGVSFPCMLQSLFSFGSWFVFFVLIEKMGETAIGVSSLVRSVYMILIIPGFAFAATANTLTSRIIGEGNAHQVKQLMGKICVNALLCASIPVLLVSVFPLSITRIFTEDLILAQAAVPVIYVVAVATLIGAVGMMAFETVSGTGNTTVAMLLEAGVLLIYVAYIYFTSKSLSIQWVWMAEWLYNLCVGAISFLYLSRADWSRKKI